MRGVSGIYRKSMLLYNHVRVTAMKPLVTINAVKRGIATMLHNTRSFNTYKMIQRGGQSDFYDTKSHDDSRHSVQSHDH